MISHLSEGSYWRHRNGALYQVECVARHTETGEDFVVYYRVDPESPRWARPLAMFLDGRFVQENP